MALSMFQVCQPCCTPAGNTACCPSYQVPDTLVAHITSGCPSCFNGVTITLTYDSGLNIWRGSALYCGSGTILLHLDLFCTGGGIWQLGVYCTGAAVYYNAASGSLCNPVHAIFTFLFNTDCCVLGQTTTTVTISE